MGLKSKKKNKKRQREPDENASENSTSDVANHLPEGEPEEEPKQNDKSYENEARAKKRKGSDSDDEDNGSHKKIKKKKKQQAAPDTTEKKGKKSIRQMKKEKHAQRQAEAEAVAKDQLKAQCVTYLSQWKHDRQNWKFMKAKQVWLYKNKFSVNLVPESLWQTFLEYFESAKGNIRNMLIEDANKIIKQMDEWTEAQEKAGDEENEEDTGVQKPDDAVYNRARSLIQCLGE